MKSSDKNKKDSPFLRVLFILIFAGIFVFSAVKVAGILTEYKEGVDIYDDVRGSYGVQRETSSQEPSKKDRERARAEAASREAAQNESSKEDEQREDITDNSAEEAVIDPSDEAGQTEKDPKDTGKDPDEAPEDTGKDPEKETSDDAEGDPEKENPEEAEDNPEKEDSEESEEDPEKEDTEKSEDEAEKDDEESSEDESESESEDESEESSSDETEDASEKDEDESDAESDKETADESDTASDEDTENESEDEASESEDGADTPEDEADESSADDPEEEAAPQKPPKKWYRPYVQDYSEHEHPEKLPFLHTSIDFLLIPPYVFDFNALISMNADVCAWIMIKDTYVDYPVVKGEDNVFYLRHAVSGVLNNAGSVFADHRHKAPFYEKNTIVYAHNQRNLRMFHQVLSYQEKDYMEEHPYIDIYLPDGSMQIYRVYSCYIETGTDAYTLRFADDQAFMDYVRYTQESALYDSGVPVFPDSRILTLVTCTNEADEERVVLHAVLVEQTAVYE